MSPESDNQLKFCCAGQRVEAKALQEGVTIFHFFQKYNSRRAVTCDTRELRNRELGNAGISMSLFVSCYERRTL
jgi:hypothetical protein